MQNFASFFNHMIKLAYIFLINSKNLGQNGKNLDSASNKFSLIVQKLKHNKQKILLISKNSRIIDILLVIYEVYACHLHCHSSPQV